MDNPELRDNQVKLYLALVDGLQKYNSILWQVPTGLLLANVVAIDKWLEFPWLLLALALFDSTLAFSFHKLVIQQRALVTAAQRAEEELRRVYPNYLPVFRKSRIRAPSLVVFAIVALNVALFLFAVAALLRGAT